MKVGSEFGHYLFCSISSVLSRINMLAVTSNAQVNPRAAASSEANGVKQPPTASSSVLGALNIPDGMSLSDFCAEKIQNICNVCADPSQAAQTMATHLGTLLAMAGEVTAGNAAKFEIVSSLTNNLLVGVTRDDLSTAQDAANQINTNFNSDLDS